ncbi:KPN_02809 family neutral zinc metallopeptidase [Paenibacillus sacheonensis]|uniref:Metalloprotease n=1 Tax=Paenibacillus sacheonensis TaxID=742054 RepID=A0A7X4YUC7_9BACL|nr:neutral zinc metallopeptidase [Paenibacillus sacheonensis]MBM7569250.1 putative metalloprotease [Paenibacillus sacheonensis]NBC71739.1 metalloprotease [Paenibacillus sacheonensis]
MQWKGRRASANVEDRRGMGGKTVIGGGIGSIVIVLLVVLLGGNPGDLLNGITGSDTGTPYEETAQDKELAQFVSVVLADTEDVWTDIFRKEGLTYEKPVLVLYSGSVDSACGSASSAVGPFYCPGDHKLYIDLSFYDELQNRFHAAGDFAMAYVIAHEVGHHVQTLLGSGEDSRPGRNATKAQTNAFSVRYELQADYFAGVWAKQEQGKQLLDKGDVDEALTAASAVGDDAIQKAAQGYVVPESFTHGTSEQRKRWFTKGLATGTVEGGDTFHAGNL